MPHIRLLLLLCTLFVSATAFAQVYTIRGTVRDAETNEKLAFVSIAANAGEAGTTTNLEGQYQLRHQQPVTSLRFSYVGYTPQVLVPDSTGVLNVYLRPAAARLQEVVVRSGENPAHRIIRLATRNRSRHHTGNLKSYTYRTYNKFILTATDITNLDLSDTLQLAPQDSSYLKMRSLLARQHLFLAESITDYSYLKPDLSNEKILATRVSGLQQPSFGIVAAEARNFSVYEDMPDFFGKRYLSPLSPGSTRRYRFTLEETAVIGQDSVFIISFEPEQGRNFDGLRGLLYITSDGWAVQNVMAESAVADDKRGMKLQQQFKKVNNQQWFPTELDVEVTVPQIVMRGHQPYGHIRTYITNINLNPDLRRRDFSPIALSQAPGAHRQTKMFWQEQRIDSLQEQDLRTYQRLDSAGRAVNLDRSIRLMEYLTTGQLPVGIISLDLRRILRVNSFEGLRLGIGAHTNKLLSERFTIGGYWGYAFGDQKQKYGADASLILHKPSALALQMAFSEDIAAPGERHFPFRKRSIIRDYRPYLLPHLDYVTEYSTSLSGRIARYMQAQVEIRQQERRPTLVPPATDAPAPAYQIAEAIVGLRYAYGEQLMQQFNQTMALPSSYPVLWLQYTKGLDNMLNGNYSYHKFDIRAEASFQQRTLGETRFTLAGGLVQGDAPFVSLYNGYGSYSDRHHIYAGEGFETMYPYEFFSDRYAALFLQQNFGKRLLRTKFFKPDLVALTNIGFGDIDHELPALEGMQYSSMRKGFYESGLLLNNIIGSAFTGIGVGAFYRYGPYALPQASDNFKVKLTLTLSF
ncbi:DUF5686 and carboxypeptidase-like regulatory domain-containing protein [Pontibacter sp. SGAir0037]|uniref:DUF5686 and carboxypeptidase-like regulatory domain-containing protein n=1 Tax=Pontibacter sp. SGAir0037 TaxID=2571030 RepID=UPI0010CD1E20|nr:DUF5686 and carboxypeptidase-like regulatory domain-containing protein [Pontibacter sp. SGAir0037]QCR24201.1 hypothetical protein C1N53_18810 [Pontibacter sp. SGAir0037]